jgi:hypothetical protein
VIEIKSQLGEGWRLSRVGPVTQIT